MGYAALVGLNDHTITAGIAPDEEPDLDVPDADLIVTLHRTIDAQLAILEEAKLQVMSRERLGLPLNTGPVRSYALARAINGAPS